jgi:hypothetical protein
MVGQNNHFLITILVGLDEVATGRASLNESFSTSWNPRDPVRSAERSREYSLKAFLAWLVDGLQAYVGELRRMPGSPIDTSTWVELQKIDGFAGRVHHLAEHLGALGGPELPLCELAITWRNQLVHTTSKAKVPPTLKSALRRHAAEIEADYQGLDVGVLLNRWAESTHAPVPSFKEATSLSRAAQRVIGELDCKAVPRVDHNAYFECLVADYLFWDGRPDTDRASRLWGRGPRRAMAALIELGKTGGMTVVIGPPSVSSELLAEMAALSPRAALARFAVDVETREDTDPRSVEGYLD